MNVLDSIVLSDLPKNQENISDNPRLRQKSIVPSCEEKNNTYSYNEMISISEKDKKKRMNGFRFLLVCSRTLDQEEKELFRLYGKLLEYDDCYMNIPLENLIDRDPEIYYIAFDIRQKNHRSTLSKELHNKMFHIVALIHKWEEMDDFIDDANCENVLCSLPIKQAFKSEFDKLLLEKKIREPSCLKSMFRIVHKACNGWQKD